MLIHPPPQLGELGADRPVVGSGSRFWRAGAAGCSALQARQAYPGGGWPPQVAHRVSSCRTGTPKMAVS